MTITEVTYQLAEARIPFSIHYSGMSDDEHYVVTVEGPIKADQLKVLTELHFNFSAGQFHFMGKLNETF